MITYMTDIMTQLRELDKHLTHQQGTPGYPAIREAVDEIDRLRRAGDELHRALEMLADPGDDWKTIDIEYLLDRWARVRK